MIIYRNDYYRIINIILFIGLLFYILFLGNKINSQFEILIYVYIILNILCSFLPRKMFYAWPVLIIRATGFIRYFLMVIMYTNDGISGVSQSVIFLMILEMLSHYMMIFIYPLTKKGIRYLKNIENIYGENNYQYEGLNDAISFNVGIIVIAILILGGVFVLANRSILIQYFSFSSHSSVQSYQSGIIALLVSVFFLLLYVIAIQFIESKQLPEGMKIVLVIILSIFFVNGTSITNSNVSRWSLLITMFIAYNFLSLYHPRQKKKFIIILAIATILAVLFGTMMKFNSGHSGYDTIENTLNSTFTYSQLNAYFSGFHNVEVSIKMRESLLDQGIFYKIKMFISDVFNNFPFLNKYLSTRSDTSVYWFNLTYYGSTIASDQIIPLVGQLFNYVGFLFVIPEMIIVYIALNTNFELKNEKELLKVYCLAYSCITFSLCNCTNLIIMLQNLWIQILPAYFIYLLNIHIRQKIIH